MALTAEERGWSIDALVRVPASTLLEVVSLQEVIPDYEDLRKRFTSDTPDEGRRQIAGLVIDAYEKSNKVPNLFEALASRLYLDEPLFEKLRAFVGKPREDAALQGAIAERANTLSLAEMQKFMSDVSPTVCVVVAIDGTDDRKARLGTGFLVSAARVLTSYHTLAAHIVPGTGEARPRVPGDNLFVIFDYCKGDAPIKPYADHNGLFKVEFARDWLKCFRENLDADGEFLSPSQSQLALLPERLDFALIELNKPVGGLPRSGPDSLQRNWVNLHEIANNLRNDDRIIIPQHPHGVPQRIDMGRYSDVDTRLDTSSTRFRYSTETDKGSSGSPCFNQNYQLVGVHNAAFKPGGITVRKNQAVRADLILAAIQKQSLPRTSAAPELWNLSTDPSKPEPILGRRTLVDWIDEARVDVTTRADRIYAAVATQRASGKSFSSRILIAATRGGGDVAVLLGNREALPPTVTDFVRIVGHMLRITDSELATMPARPDSQLPDGADGDKLRRWASEEVPMWLATLFARTRVQKVDLRERARATIAELKALGIDDIQPNLLKLANSADPVVETTNRWEHVWIVLDGLGDARLNPEISDCVAGLIGTGFEESRVADELRRIRWLFLGTVPDFLPRDDVTAEKLDAMAIGADDIVANVGSLLRTFDKEFAPDVHGPMIKGLIDSLMVTSAAELADSLSRLATLQLIASEVARAFAQIVGIDK